MAANRVFIVKPQRNSIMENHAIARAIRNNQKNSILETSYVVNGIVGQVSYLTDLVFERDN